jgi:short-chain dehydrogenase/reductase SDR
MNTTVVITGGGGVLCSAFAKEMARTGAPVALLDRNLQAAEHTAEEIAQEGGTARAYAADVLDRESLEAAHAAVLRDFGKCRVLINGAGGNHPKATTAQETFPAGTELPAELPSFFDLQPEGFDFVFRLNLMGTLLPSQVFARDMLGEGGCCILNVSSMNAYRPLTKIPAYSAAKAAVSNFTQWLAVHFAEQGIRVNAIAPGFFVTGQNRSLLFDEEGNPTERTAKILRATPMKRFGEPEELLGALRWLTDEKASGFVTGVVVPVDGGFSAYSGV